MVPFHERQPAVVGIGSGLVVAFDKLHPTRLFVFLSSISYSMYLHYVPNGGRIVNLGMRFPGTLANRVVILTLAIAASVLASYLFYRFIELRSQRWSSALRHTPGEKPVRAAVYDDVVVTTPQIPASEML